MRKKKMLNRIMTNRRMLKEKALCKGKIVNKVRLPKAKNILIIYSQKRKIMNRIKRLTRTIL